MATENAIETLRALKTQWANDTHKQSQSLAELETALELPRTPNRIECYDISNTQGTLSVGSMVVFEQGIPRKAHYRRFNIKTVEGPNDFESMTEVFSGLPLVRSRPAHRPGQTTIQHSRAPALARKRAPELSKTRFRRA